MNKIEKKFSWRSFISFTLLYTFIIISLTGIILYLAPAGRISNWVNWKLFGFTKAEWQALHTVFSYTFLILGIFHLFSINWKVFISYIKNKTKQGLNKKKELYLSSIFTVIFFFGIIYSIPPFSSIMDFGEYLTESWENTETEPPVPHAEILTLLELSEKLDSISIDMIKNRLESAKIKYNNVNETIDEIGTMNNIPPIDIYNIITKKTNTEISGSGIGKKTLEQFANENNKDLNKILEVLKENGIEANKDQTIKDIASENDKAAKDIYELIK